MIPNQSLSTPAEYAPFLSPDELTLEPLVDYQRGGIGLSNASAGLQYQNWTAWVTGVDLTTQIWVSSANTAATLFITAPGIVWVRLAFDQNMHPAIVYVDQGGPKLFWWDPTIPGNTTKTLDATVQFPCVTMDDKRALETTIGKNDVILAYINNNNLCYRQERDRYNTEYILYSSINNLLSNPILVKIGMSSIQRLNFFLKGQLYQ